MAISFIGTVVMITLFVFELNAYFKVTTTTTLVVDELADDMLRMNFNVTLHQVPCDYLTLDVSDTTGLSRHNITKDILKWRLDQHQNIIETNTAHTARTLMEQNRHPDTEHETHGGVYDHLVDEEDYEPPDTNLSQPLTEDTFKPFLQEHELTVVNFFAPWCIWCRRFEPVYVDAASKIPDLHFHGHARLSQVDCVANQAFCSKSQIRAYPTVRMYKDGDPVNFELYTGARTVGALLSFIQQQMDQYNKAHHIVRKTNAARFEIKHGALSAGSDLYRARMTAEDAETYCGTNDQCSGFTWQSKQDGTSPPSAPKTAGKEDNLELALVYFKGGLTIDAARQSMNTDQAWSAYIKVANATSHASASGSVDHGPEGCRIAGHLSVRKVPGALKLYLHSPEHDHVVEKLNSSHIVNEMWFGDPLSKMEVSRLPPADAAELLSPTSHRLDDQSFISEVSGHSHVHYLKVVTKVIKHQAKRFRDTLAYKYTVHSNRYDSTDGVPVIEFTYDLSPISIVLEQLQQPFYRFITSSCAIIGGVFTVIGLLENIIHYTAASVMKKTI
uniref:Thioredoxin domain-containing protein n=1 Tax=Haptolina brevifila TaxID=156173 RepID=A0A7S2GNX8_9EUKA